MARASKDGRPQPAGVNAGSRNAKIAWALNRVLARINDKAETGGINRAAFRLEKEIRKALNGINWESWARANLKIETTTSTDADGVTHIKKKLVPKRKPLPGKPLTPPGLTVRRLPELIAQLGKDAAEFGWLRAQEDAPGPKRRRAKKALWAQKKQRPGIIQLPPPETGVFVALPEAALNMAVIDSMSFAASINSNLLTSLNPLLLDSMASGTSFSGFSKLIRAKMPDFSRARAHKIAVTEYRRVSSNATRLSYEAQGIDGKRWNTVGDDLVCPTCEANEDQGPIGINGDFQSGDINPPAHPLCRCNISGVRLKKK